MAAMLCMAETRTPRLERRFQQYLQLEGNEAIDCVYIYTVPCCNGILSHSGIGVD